MSPAVTFPFPPGPRDGTWEVKLPGDASVGEVIVYAEAVVGPPVATFYRWKCDESALPLLEVAGFNHQLAVGAPDTAHMTFGETSMRADGTGHAISSDSPVDVDAHWTPAITRGTSTDFAIAALLGRTGDALGALSNGNVALDGIMDMRRETSSFAPVGPRFYLYNGTGITSVDIYSGGATSGTEVFVAFRVSAGGVWKRWVGDHTASGTFAGWSPTSTWHVAGGFNDPHMYKWQEIHVWDTAASDAQIEAVRLDLIGV